MNRRCCSFALVVGFVAIANVVAAAEPKLTVVLDAKQVTNPFGVDFDGRGNVFIAEYLGGRLWRLDSDGELHQLAGNGKTGFSGDGGDARKAVFNGVHNVVRAPNGDLILSDTRNNLIRKIDAETNKVSTIAGVPGKKGFSGDGGAATQAMLADPISIALAPDGDTLLIADIQNRRIRAMSLKSGVIRTVAGNGKKGRPQDGEAALEQPLVDPRACDMDADGNLYILERGGHALRVVRSNGRIYTLAGSGKKGHRDGDALQAQLAGPKHLCLDAHGNILIADDLNHAIRLYDPKAKTVTTILGGDASPRTQLQRPHGLRVDAKGRLWICDSWNDRVLILENYLGR